MPTYIPATLTKARPEFGCTDSCRGSGRSRLVPWLEKDMQRTSGDEKQAKDRMDFEALLHQPGCGNPQGPAKVRAREGGETLKGWNRLDC